MGNTKLLSIYCSQYAYNSEQLGVVLKTYLRPTHARRLYGLLNPIVVLLSLIFPINICTWPWVSLQTWSVPIPHSHFNAPCSSDNMYLGCVLVHSQVEARFGTCLL